MMWKGVGSDDLQEAPRLDSGDRARPRALRFSGWRPMSDPFKQLAASLGDRYAIERELGADGMATVYLAHDERHGRKVAVKILRTDRETPPPASALVGHSLLPISYPQP